MEDGGSGEVASKEAGGVWQQPCSRVQDCQAEEGNRPHTVEDLKKVRIRAGLYVDNTGWDEQRLAG